MNLGVQLDQGGKVEVEYFLVEKLDQTRPDVCQTKKLDQTRPDVCQTKCQVDT